MAECTREDLQILLAHLMRSPEVIQAAIASNLKADEFDESTESLYAVFWNISKAHWDEYQRPVSKAFVFPEVLRLIKDTELDDGSFKDMCVATIEDIWALDDKDLLPPYAEKILESFVFERRISNRFLTKLEESGGVTKKLWESFNDEISKVRTIQGRIITPFAPGSKPMFGSRPREATGVMFLDDMMDGGVRKGELYGFLAPSSGGKTTFSTQLLYEYCRRKHRAILLSYEEKVAEEYMSKLYSTGTGIPLKRIEQLKTLEDLTPEERIKYDRLEAEACDHLHIMDLSGADGSGAGNGGVEEIGAMLTKFAAEGRPVEAVIIDWFWPMLSRRFQLEESKKNNDERKYVQLITDKLKQLALKHNCWIWVNQQLTPSKASAKKVEWYDSAEAKSFAWYMNGCFTLTSLSNENVGTFRYSKARSSAKKEVIVRLRGELARFEWVTEDVEYDERRQQYVLKGTRDRVMEDPQAVAAMKQQENNLGLEPEVSV